MFAILAGCGGQQGDTLALVPITDVDPAPQAVEVQLVATASRIEYLPGKSAEVWAFRDGAKGGAGTIPGPLIELRQGDQVVVNFRNELPEPTTIHWHGLRVPPMSDGTPSSQMPVPPGGTFQYRFTATDVGTFWYHPHVNGDVQVEKGLYGALVVRGGVEPAVEADRTFILDDVKLEASGELSRQTDQLDLMLGRQGNVLLVNGRSGGKLGVRAGSRERWRFINSANGRYFNLALDGHRFLVIGWDGGLLPRPYQIDTLLISPGERYEVLVELMGTPGATLPLRTLHYDRGHEIPDPGPLDLVQLSFGEGGAPPAALPGTWGSLTPIPVAMDTPERSFVLTEKDPDPEPEFFINSEKFPRSTPTHVTTEDVAIWRVKNETEMDHPFHLHGMFFQVLDVDGVPPAQGGWKDTVNVPQKKTLRFAVRYGEPGMWMYHCHILEHAERGMMGELMIMPRR